MNRRDLFKAVAACSAACAVPACSAAPAAAAAAAAETQPITITLLMANESFEVTLDAIGDSWSGGGVTLVRTEDIAVSMFSEDSAIVSMQWSGDLFQNVKGGRK